MARNEKRLEKIENEKERWEKGRWGGVRVGRGTVEGEDAEHGDAAGLGGLDGVENVVPSDRFDDARV